MVWRHGFHPFGVAREDVRGIQVREIDAARTLLLTGTLVGGLFWTIRRAIREGMTT